MAIISIEEYAKKFPEESCIGYISSLAQPPKGLFPAVLLKTGMVHWPINPERWGGPFKGGYAFMDLTNYATTCGELKTEAELLAHQYAHHLYNLYYIKRRNELKAIFKLEGHGYFPVTSTEGNKCSRSEMTHEELMMVVDLFGNEWFEEHKAQAKAKVEAHPWYLDQQTKERPYKLYLCGNDDTSFSAFTATEAEANAIISQLNANAGEHILDKYFAFSN